MAVVNGIYGDFVSEYHENLLKNMTALAFSNANLERKLDSVLETMQFFSVGQSISTSNEKYCFRKVFPLKSPGELVEFSTSIQDDEQKRKACVSVDFQSKFPCKNGAAIMLA